MARGSKFGEQRGTTGGGSVVVVMRHHRHGGTGLGSGGEVALASAVPPHVAAPDGNATELATTTTTSRPSGQRNYLPCYYHLEGSILSL